MTGRPILVPERMGDVRVWTDPVLIQDVRVRIAFTERAGGRSLPPFTGLDLAAHVGDDATAVDENRSALMDALGLAAIRDRLTTADQVHGLTVREASGASVGMGAFALPGRPPPIPDADALFTTVPDAPLMLLFADCVPVVLVAPGPMRGIAVVHAGWKGALGRLPGKTAAPRGRRTCSHMWVRTSGPATMRSTPNGCRDSSTPLVPLPRPGAVWTWAPSLLRA
jgi:copper oxidase (laccase) domain-containing protein